MVQKTDKSWCLHYLVQSQATGRGAPAPDGGSGKGTQMSPRAMTMDEANELLTGGYKVW